MAAIISTGLRNALLASSSLKQALANGVIKIYAGSIPADADSSILSATLLVTVSLNDTGSGINFASTAVGGVLTKDLAEIWSGTCVYAGTPTFFRHVLPADNGEASTTALRIQGTVGSVGTDLIIPTLPLTAGRVVTLDSYSITLPSS